MLCVTAEPITITCVLLEGVAGVSAGPYNILEVSEVRRSVRDIVGGGWGSTVVCRQVLVVGPGRPVSGGLPRRSLRWRSRVRGARPGLCG